MKKSPKRWLIAALLIAIGFTAVAAVQVSLDSPATFPVDI